MQSGRGLVGEVEADLRLEGFGLALAAEVRLKDDVGIGRQEPRGIVGAEAGGAAGLPGDVLAIGGEDVFAGVHGVEAVGVLGGAAASGAGLCHVEKGVMEDARIARVQFDGADEAAGIEAGGKDEVADRDRRRRRRACMGGGA